MANDIPISERELEILRLVATGATNQQIAQQLSISVNTVKVHLRNIFSKIGVVSRTEATIYAISNGLVSVDKSDAGIILAAETAPALTSPPGSTPSGDIADTPVSAPIVAPTTPDAALTPPSSGITSIRRLWLTGLAIGASLLTLIVAIVWLQGPTHTSVLPSSQPTDSNSPNQPDQRWFILAPLPNPRDDFALTAYTQDRKLYTIGGQVGGTPSAAIDRYDPESNLWVSLTDKPTAVSNAGAIVLRGKIYVPGGEETGGKISSRLEIYEPREQRWETGTPMPAGRSRYGLAVIEGQLYVIGGWDGTQARSEVFIYNPERNTWSTGPALPTPRQSAGIAVASDRIFVIGGSNDDTPLRDTIRLDPAIKGAGWESLAPLPAAIAMPATAAVINSILAFDSTSHNAWQYDQSTDAWHPLSIPDTAVLAPALTMLDSSLFFITGRSTPNSGTLSEYLVLYTTFVPRRP